MAKNNNKNEPENTVFNEMWANEGTYRLESQPKPIRSNRKHWISELKRITFMHLNSEITTLHKSMFVFDLISLSVNK